MRNYEEERVKRVSWIQSVLAAGRANGVVFGNSGGKDSALVGLLCKMATDNVIGVMMPCETKQNYGSDMEHAKMLAEQAGIETMSIDLTQTKKALTDEINKSNKATGQALSNVTPRLRMTTLYAIAQSLGYLVAGTGNKSETYMGYFTKWGDGACDFNPVSDLYAHEIFDFLSYLKAPAQIIQKEPSAGLFEGQTDEAEMGVTYKAIQYFIETGKGDPADTAIISKAHNVTEHKRRMPLTYSEND